MAFAEVGSGSQRATTHIDNVDSTTLAFPGNVVSGNLLVVAGSVYQAGGPPATITVTDTLSTTYTVVTSTSGEYKGYIAYGVAPSSGACTVTVDPTGTGNYLAFCVDEFSGQHATPFSVDGGSSTSTGTAVADSITTATANELIIGCMYFTDTSNVTLTPGGSYTQIGEFEDNNNQAFNAVFRIATTATSYNVDWTTGSSVTWTAQTAAFKAAEDGGASNSAGSGTAASIGSALSSVQVNSAGNSTAVNVGAGTASATANGNGISTATSETESEASGLATSNGVSSSAAVGEAVSTTEYAAASSGTSTSEADSASEATGAASSAGESVATFVGVDATVATSHNGPRGRAIATKQRKKQQVRERKSMAAQDEADLAVIRLAFEKTLSEYLKIAA